MHTIINLFGGPGAGKSTIASGVFYRLKLLKIHTELITEFAKDLTWEQRHKTLENQFYITAKQHHRIWRVLKYFEDHNINNNIIVTDSPLLLGILYNKYFEDLNPFILKEFNKMTPFNIRNINFFIERENSYDSLGRNQSLSKAKKIDKDILNLLESNNINFKKIKGNESAPKKIIDYLISQKILERR